MKKSKLKLDELRVKSFVTVEKRDDAGALKAGAAGTHYSWCSFRPCDCEDTFTPPIEPEPFK